MIPYLLAALGGYLIGESQKKYSVEAPQMGKGGETGAASIKIKLKDGVISVYHSDGSKLMSWKAKKGDWDKLWDRFNYLAHQQMAKGGETGAAEIKVELKNGNISIFHSDGSKLMSWKANKGDWDEIWNRMYDLSGFVKLKDDNKGMMADGGEMAKGGMAEKLYYHKTSGGAEYLMSSRAGYEGSFDSRYIVRIDGAKKYGGMLLDKENYKKIKLYYHKTSGGAEYLCSNYVKGTDEGSFDSKYIVRIDGAKTHGGELLIKDDKKFEDGGMTDGGGYFEYIIWDEITDDPNDDNEGYIYGINFIDGDSGEALDSQWFKSEEERDEFINKNGLIEYDYDSEEYSKGGKIAEDSGLYLTKKGKKTSVSGQPNPYFFGARGTKDSFGEDNIFSEGGGRYGGWWKSSSNYSIKKFEELVKERIPTDDVKFDSESGMFYAEGSDTRMRKFYRDLIDSATMDYPSEFPFKSDTEYFNWESKRLRKAKNDIKEGRDKEAIDGFYFQMFSNYGEKSIKNELKKLFKKIDSAEMGDSDSKYHISEEKAVQMVADVFKNVDKYNTEVHDTEPENNIIFFAQEKLKKRGYPRRYYVNLMDNVREYMYDEEGQKEKK